MKAELIKLANLLGYIKAAASKRTANIEHYVDEALSVLEKIEKEGRIVINVSGGLVQAVFQNTPADVVIVDYDIEGVTAEDLARDHCLFPLQSSKGYGRAYVDKGYDLSEIDDEDCLAGIEHAYKAP
jgi:putative aminopeptidase FrvX